jgi:uncharacterized membrane protein YqjE
MPPAGAPPPGLFESLRSMLATSIELVQTRLELIVVELEEEMHRLAVTLLWSIVGILAGGLTVLLLAVTIVIAFWDGHRLLAASLVTVVFALITATAVYVVRQRGAQRPGLLAATLAELRRDARGLRRRP